jgi:hypothetical protein
MRNAIAITLGVALALIGTTALAARNSSGTYSLEPAAPFVTNTPISSSTMNTRFSSIATALTDSLSRGGSGPMLSALSLYSGGSATVPELSWADDSNSGLYLISNDNLGLSIGGTKRWDFAAAGSSLTGTFDVSGATSLASTLTVTGATALRSTLAVTGATTLTGALTGTTATLDALTLGTLTVAHAATFTDPVTVGTATDSQHAATKAYVDAGFVVSTIAVPLTGDWTASAADAAPRFWKDRFGVVHFMGSATATAGVTLAVAAAGMPAGYRPAGSRTFWTAQDDTTITGTKVMVAATGSIQFGAVGAGKKFFFDAIQYLAEQ